MMKNEIKIKHWTQLQEVLFTDSWNDDINRFRSPFAFRGIEIDNGIIESSLMNLRGNYVQMERHLLRNFRKYAHRNVVEADSVWNWLSLAKHHGLPTRLVDWSFSPLVALHFAVQNTRNFDKSAAIWMVNYIEVHKHIPADLKKKLDHEGSDVFTVEILTEQFSSLNDFDSSSDKNYLLYFEPPSMDERIINQFALFSTISSPSLRTDEWLKDYPEVFKKIIIPPGLKLEIRDKLDQMNITERVLFPGLDGLSKWLARQYTSFDK
jgi:hypothetical protein